MRCQEDKREREREREYSWWDLAVTFFVLLVQISFVKHDTLLGSQLGKYFKGGLNFCYKLHLVSSREKKEGT